MIYLYVYLFLLNTCTYNTNSTRQRITAMYLAK